MPDFICGDYVYFNYNDEIPKNHHKHFIMKQEPQFNITYPMRLLEEKWKHFQKCLFKILDPWILKMSKLLQNYQ